MRVTLLLAAVVLLCGCGSASKRVLVVRVRGESSTAPSVSKCFLLIRQHVAGGGTSTYCLEAYSGRPGPNATLEDRGVMTFALPNRTIRAHVHIDARFRADGRHATQTLRGRVARGGSITGGGHYVESPPGHVASADLRYVITLTA